MPCVPEDKMLQTCICRAKLNAFWYQEPKTVASNLHEAKKGLLVGEEWGLGNPFPNMGPFPLADVSE